MTPDDRNGIAITIAFLLVAAAWAAADWWGSTHP